MWALASEAAAGCEGDWALTAAAPPQRLYRLPWRQHGKYAVGADGQRILGAAAFHDAHGIPTASKQPEGASCDTARDRAPGARAVGA